MPTCRNLIVICFAFLCFDGVIAACIHDELMVKNPPIEIARRSDHRTQTNTLSLEPFRPYFVTSFLSAGDPRACFFVNQITTDGHTCESSEVITAAKREFIINSILPQISLWANSTLSIDANARGNGFEVLILLIPRSILELVAHLPFPWRV